MQLTVEGISFRYGKRLPWILKDVDFTIKSGQRIGLLGTSGYGKSTLGKILAGYEKPIEGKVLLDGRALDDKGYCPVQMIHQHPELAVNPRWKMRQILYEAYTPEEKLLQQMGLELSWLNRWPRELSGGELQRFCIARALAPETKFLVCDEITTMLDVITQAQIWQFLLEVAEKRQLGMVIITHNPELGKRVCTDVVRIDELGT
ncbi:MAG: ATP-binding cassette domain-containing protein [Lachnospiraceae bacterium]|nr:ATP-binding cassette domain-containing protein [Lachnospiraceae bacterium]